MLKDRGAHKVGSPLLGQLAAFGAEVMIFQHLKLLVDVMHLTTAIALRGTEVTPPVGAADIDCFEDALHNEGIWTLTGGLREEIAPLPSPTNRRIERHLGPFRLAELLALTFERQQRFVGSLMRFVHGVVNE